MLWKNLEKVCKTACQIQCKGYLFYSSVAEIAMDIQEGQYEDSSSHSDIGMNIYIRTYMYSYLKSSKLILKWGSHCACE